MWAAIRTLRLFIKSLVRIANSLEELKDLYQLELSAKGITRPNPSLSDPVEVQYGAAFGDEEL